MCVIDQCVNVKPNGKNKIYDLIKTLCKTASSGTTCRQITHEARIITEASHVLCLHYANESRYSTAEILPTQLANEATDIQVTRTADGYKLFFLAEKLKTVLIVYGIMEDASGYGKFEVIPRREEGRRTNERSRQADDCEVRFEEGRWRLEQEHRNRLQEAHHDPSVNAATPPDSFDYEYWEAQLEEDCRRLAEVGHHEETATVNARATRTERQPPSLANTRRRDRNPTQPTNYKEEFQSPSFFTQTIPRDDGVTASVIPSYNAHRFLDLGLNNTSSLDIEARHWSIAEATGQPRFQEVQTGRYPHSYYQLQTADVRPISAPPQNNALDDGSRRAVRKMTTPGPTGLTRLSSEPGPMMQTRISAWTSGKVMMFDHIDCNDESTKKTTDEWFRTFEKHVLQMFPETRQKRPVRIAVLDTGIDLTNSAISREDRRKIKDIKSFVPNENSDDQVGHGTHIALLLLRMAYNADIYVARVAQGKKLDDPSYIADALRYATEKWKVDIINMSFGFNFDEPAAIEDAIRKAYAADVLMFAAACNEGGNQGVAFPARHPNVICIRSTDGKGAASKFSPPVFDRNDNFATIGESLGPCSSKGLPVSRYSGTSYATPVAVSIASLVLEFVRENFGDDKRDDMDRWLKKSPDNMRAALKHMSNEITDHRYITPWKLFGRGKEHVRLCLTYAMTNPDHWSK